MDEYKVKKSNREAKVAKRRSQMPVNGLGFVRLAQQEIAKGAKKG
jgi:hypothetical protein